MFVFYRKRKTIRHNPFLVYSWAVSSPDCAKLLIDDIVSTMIEKYSKTDYLVKDYTPNNDKLVIDKLEATSNLVSNVYDDLIEALAKSTAYSKDVGKINGFIIKGIKNADKSYRKNYLLIGIGTPVKRFRHSFANQSVMQEERKEFITIKPYFDIFISNETCYLDGSYAQSFFDLSTIHITNMRLAYEIMSESGLITDLPEVYPSRGKSIFTDIFNCIDVKDIKSVIQYFINQKSIDPDNEHYSALKIKEGKIDASDLNCYFRLVDLLSGRVSSEGLLQGEIRPIKARLSPPQINPRDLSQ